jgi:Uma2 family endonuclease
MTIAVLPVPPVVSLPPVASPRTTLKEYLAGPPDEFKAELIYGVKVMCPSPTAQHQDATFNITLLLRRWVLAKGLGRVNFDLDMVLDEANDLAYRPDVLYVAKENEARWQQGRVFGPADLCVEILSPSERPHRQRRKFADYERYAVPWYWIIDQEKMTIEENQLVGTSFQLRAEIEGDNWFAPGLFPGLEFQLRPLIEGDLKAAVRGEVAAMV